jgi:hypothetical protein
MRDRVVRVRRITDQEEKSELYQTTPSERLCMMWQLALDAWAFMGESLAESRLPRHVVRIVQRGR